MTRPITRYRTRAEADEAYRRFLERRGLLKTEPGSVAEAREVARAVQPGHDWSQYYKQGKDEG